MSTGSPPSLVFDGRNFDHSSLGSGFSFGNSVQLQEKRKTLDSEISTSFLEALKSAILHLL